MSDNITHINVPEWDNELAYRASTIDGTALAIAEFCAEKESERFTRFCLHEFHTLLQISIQTKDEEEFFAHLETVWKDYVTKAGLS